MQRAASAGTARPRSTFEEYADAKVKQEEDHWRRQANPKAPVFKICYICGRQFGTQSLAIHQPVCLRKWELEQSRLPPEQRRTLPKPDEFEAIVAKSGKSELDVYNDAAEAAFNESLSPCPNCGRTFLPDRLAVHLRSCREPKPLAERRAAAKAASPKSPAAEPIAAGKGPSGSPKTAGAQPLEIPSRPSILVPINKGPASPTSSSDTQGSDEVRQRNAVRFDLSHEKARPVSSGAKARSKTPVDKGASANGGAVGAVRKSRDKDAGSAAANSTSSRTSGDETPPKGILRAQSAQAQRPASVHGDRPRSAPKGPSAGVGGFCVECGAPYPVATAKFCMDCGAKRPQALNATV